MAIKDNWVLLQNSYSVVSVWGTEDTFIQHGFRTALVLNNEDIFYLVSLLIQDGFSMGHCCTEVVFIQHGFRTPLVPDISKAKIFVFYFSIDTGWFQYEGTEKVFIQHELHHQAPGYPSTTYKYLTYLFRCEPNT